MVNKKVAFWALLAGFILGIAGMTGIYRVWPSVGLKMALGVKETTTINLTDTTINHFSYEMPAVKVGELVVWEKERVPVPVPDNLPSIDFIYSRRFFFQSSDLKITGYSEHFYASPKPNDWEYANFHIDDSELVIRLTQIKIIYQPEYVAYPVSLEIAPMFIDRSLGIVLGGTFHVYDIGNFIEFRSGGFYGIKF